MELYPTQKDPSQQKRDILESEHIRPAFKQGYTDPASFFLHTRTNIVLDLALVVSTEKMKRSDARSHKPESTSSFFFTLKILKVLTAVRDIRDIQRKPTITALPPWAIAKAFLKNRKI
jgi:hypothetical protein